MAIVPTLTKLSQKLDPSLIGIISEEERLKTLTELWTLCDNDLYKPYFLLPQFHLLEYYQWILEQENILFHEQVLRTLWFLTRNAANRVHFCLIQNLPLLVLLMNFLRNHHPYSRMIQSFFLNCSLSNEGHKVLLSSQVGYVEYIANQIRQEQQAIDNEPEEQALPMHDPYRQLGYISMSIDNENVPLLLQHGLHELVINRLYKCGPVPADWNNRNNGHEYWCLTFLVDIISQPSAIQAIRSMDDLHVRFRQERRFERYFLDLLACPEIESIKSLCILCAVSDSAINYEQIFSRYPHLLPFLIKVIILTVACDEGPQAYFLHRKGYAFGILTMRVLCTTLLTLATSNTIRRNLIQTLPKYFQELLIILTRFIEDQPEFRVKDSTGYTVAGGGGRDYITIQAVLELLVLFQSSSEDDLFPGEITIDGTESEGPKLQLLSLLERLLGLPSQRIIPPEIIILAQHLLNELRTSPARWIREDYYYL